ncbi:MAG: hypothetical protein AAGA97_00945 [Pseudomonadota bacterium]
MIKRTTNATAGGGGPAVDVFLLPKKRLRVSHILERERTWAANQAERYHMVAKRDFERDCDALPDYQIRFLTPAVPGVETDSQVEIGGIVYDVVKVEPRIWKSIFQSSFLYVERFLKRETDPKTGKVKPWNSPDLNRIFYIILVMRGAEALRNLPDGGGRQVA